MFDLSRKNPILAVGEYFLAKLPEKFLNKEKPTHIIVRLNGRFICAHYLDNETYDVKVAVKRRINYAKFYLRYKNRTVSIGSKLILRINFNIPTYLRFWEKRWLSLNPISLFTFTNRKSVEFSVLANREIPRRYKWFSIAIGKSHKRKLITDRNKQRVKVKVGKGLKLATLFLIDQQNNKTFVGFRLIFRSRLGDEINLHPSHHESFSNWNDTYSKLADNAKYPMSKIAYAVYLDATGCEWSQISRCLEFYNRQTSRNFTVFLFTSHTVFKKQTYGFKLKLIPCKSDFCTRYLLYKKERKARFEFSFVTNARTLIPEDFFTAANEALRKTDCDFLYFDSVNRDANGSAYHFRSKFDPVNLMSRNCLGSSFIIKSVLLSANGPFRPYSLADVHRFFLSPEPIVAKDGIGHLPIILDEQFSFCDEYLKSTLSQSEIQGLKGWAGDLRHQSGKLRLIPSLPKTLPLVSLIVPSAGNLKFLLPFLDSLVRRTDYQAIELILTMHKDNYKAVKSKLNLDGLSLPKVVLVKHSFDAFNYSKIINHALDHAKGDCICLLNDDLEFINPFWLQDMIRWLHHKDTGIVGALLMYPDRKVQHAGITMGINGPCDHAERGFYGTGSNKISHLTKHPRSVSAVTGACLLAARSTFDQLGGLEEKFAEAYNDVDFCLRAKDIGHNVVMSPRSKIYHHESVNVGSPLSDERLRTFQKEVDLFLGRYWKQTQKDEYYPTNLSRDCPYSEFSYPPMNGFSWRKNIPLVASERAPLKEWETKIPLDLGRVCVFSHFDPDGKVADHVLEYLKEIKKNNWSIVFATSCGNLDAEERAKLSSYVSRIIGTHGEGRDWGNYSLGYNYLCRHGEIKTLLLANDSVYGPTRGLWDFFEFAEASSADIIGMTNSLQYGDHIQSYFILCKERLCSHNLFDHYWKNFYYQSNKDEIIYKNEIGFSLLFSRYGFRAQALYDYENLARETMEIKSFGHDLLEKGLYVNPTHHFMELLLEKHDFPFVKVELLKLNPSGIRNLNKITKLIKAKNELLHENINDHIKRIGPVRITESFAQQKLK